MEALSGIVIDWDHAITYLKQCSSLPWGAAACRPLWSWLSTGLVFVGTLLLLWAIWRLIASWLKYRAALRAAEYRRRVEADEALKMGRRKDGDDFLRGSTDVEFYARLNQNLDRRQLQERGVFPPET